MSKHLNYNCKIGKLFQAENDCLNFREQYMDQTKTQNLLTALKNYLNHKLENSNGLEIEELKEKIQFCREVLLFLVSLDEGSLERMCPVNLKRQNRQFQQQYESVDSMNYQYNDRLFLICAAYLGELILYWERVNAYENEKYKNFSYYWSDFKNNKYSLDQNLSEEVHRILYQMPIDILNAHIGQKDYQAFLNYEKTVEEAEDKITKLQTQLNNEEKRFNSKVLEREEKVENLKANLESFQTAFNFVGSSKGFESLLNKKNRAKWWTFAGLVTLLLAALVPLSFSFYKFIQGDDLSLQKMLPVIGLEFVLIYFFRVVLTHYHSIQTQIMQLELRQSLCQFIQSYAEYAKEIKASDKDALEKFENLIFSSILSNPDKVPGTFDGIDGLTSLLKEIKGSK